MIDVVQTSTLLTGVQTAPLDLLAQALLAATGASYLAGVRRLVRRGRRWPWTRTVVFFAGLGLVWVAVGSGLATYDESSVTLHVVQHGLLMMIAPPLLASGQPVLLAAQSTRRPSQVRLTRLLRSAPVAVLTHPMPTWVLYIGAMFLIFVDRSFYDYLIAHPLAHDASHGLLLGVGLLYWHPLIGNESVRRVSPPARVLGVMLAMPFESFVGVWLMVATRPIDPINTLADTRSAGQMFLVLATLAGGVWGMVAIGQWYRQVAREDRRVTERSEAAGWAWTVPWWERAVDPAEPPGSAAGGLNAS